MNSNIFIKDLVGVQAAKLPVTFHQVFVFILEGTYPTVSYFLVFHLTGQNDRMRHIFSPLGWLRLRGGLTPFPSCVSPSFSLRSAPPYYVQFQNDPAFPPLGLTMGWAGVAGVAWPARVRALVAARRAVCV